MPHLSRKQVFLAWTLIGATLAVFAGVLYGVFLVLRSLSWPQLAGGLLGLYAVSAVARWVRRRRPPLSPEEAELAELYRMFEVLMAQEGLSPSRARPIGPSRRWVKSHRQALKEIPAIARPEPGALRWYGKGEKVKVGP